MSFEEYMEGKFPGYKEIVPADKLAELKKDYEMKVAFDQEARGYLSRTSSAGIDYSNKFEKAMGNANRYAGIIEDKIENIKAMSGMFSEEEVEKTTNAVHR